MAGEDGLFIYGIVPADVEPAPEAEGVGDPPHEVTAIRHGDLAALVSPVGLREPLGRPADRTAYETLLDGTAVVAPVLPVRFGTVVTGPDVVGGLLAAHHEQLAAALDEFEDRLQYTVHGRFDERAFIGDFLAEHAAAAALADQARGRPEAESRERRTRLGGMIGHAAELRRETVNCELIDAVDRYVAAHVPRPPSHQLDAVNVAFLVGSDDEEEFVRVVEDFAGHRRGLIRMRLLGPLAPYDFVNTSRLVG